MYTIEPKEYGYCLTFAETISPDEMKKWVEESRGVLKGAPAKFSVFVDMRNLKALTQETTKVMEEGQKLYKTSGMVRSVVILANPIVTLQFKRIAKETGIYEWERYLNTEECSNWEETGVKWIVHGVDPDKI